MKRSVIILTLAALALALLAAGAAAAAPARAWTLGARADAHVLAGRLRLVRGRDGRRQPRQPVGLADRLGAVRRQRRPADHGVQHRPDLEGDAGRTRYTQGLDRSHAVRHASRRGRARRPRVRGPVAIRARANVPNRRVPAGRRRQADSGRRAPATASWPNGIAFHGRHLYMTDSGLGAVWRARIGGRHGHTGQRRGWSTTCSRRVTRRRDRLGMHGIGANGIAFRGDRLFVSVADYGRIVRVTLHADGSHGTPATICERPETEDRRRHRLRRRSAACGSPPDSGTTDTSPSGGALPADALRLPLDDRRRSWLAQLPDHARLRDDRGNALYPVRRERRLSTGGRTAALRTSSALPVAMPGLPLW